MAHSPWNYSNFAANRLRQSAICTAFNWVIFYDIFNRLLTGPSSAALSYDPAGRLYETSGSGATTTRFLYDGADIIGEFDTSGTLLRRYVHGPNGPIVWYEGAGTTTRRWLIPDQLGSSIAITDDTGAAVNINRYDEYGRPGPSNIGRFQYAGAPWIAETGLYHMGARAYSPTVGRFMQTDPILTAGGMNIYAYVANDPLNAIDPSGLKTTQECLTYPGGCGRGGGGGGTITVTANRCSSGWTCSGGNQTSAFVVTSRPQVLNDFGETIRETSDGEIVITARRPETTTRTRPPPPPPPPIPWWIIRPTALGAAIWVFTPTDVADATCRSATNPGGYDCSPTASDEPRLGPPYMSNAPDPYRDALDACHNQCIGEVQNGLWGPRGVGGASQPGNYRRCMRSCMAKRGFDNY